MMKRLENIALYGNYAVYVIVAIIGIAINFWTFDKCMVMADDAWYLCLMRELPSGINSSGHLLLFNVFNDNIYVIRIACYILNIIAGGVFALGLYFYSERWLVPDRWKNSSPRMLMWVLLWLFVIFAGQLRVITCPSFNYITMNQIVTQFSLGLLLISMTRKSYVAMLFSGFFIAMLIPIMITNIIFIPFVLVFIVLYTYTNDKASNWLSFSLRQIAVYALGMLLFLVMYFVFVEDIKTYISIFLNKYNYTVSLGENDYGIKFLYKWLHRTMVLYFMQVVMLAFVLHYTPVLAAKMNLQGKSSIVFKVVLYLAVVAYIRAAVNYDINFFLWLLAFYMFLDEKNVTDRKKQLLFGLLVLAPICLSFGTNNTFKDRGFEYMSFVTPLLFVCSARWWQKAFVSIALVFYAIEMFASLYAPTWHGDIYVEQDCSLKTIGIDQEIYVDSKTLERLVFMQQHLSCGDTVWCDTENWGCVELLHLVPISYEYFMNTDLVDSVDNVIVRRIDRYSGVIEQMDGKQDYKKYNFKNFVLYQKK